MQRVIEVEFEQKGLAKKTWKKNTSNYIQFLYEETEN